MNLMSAIAELVDLKLRDLEATSEPVMAHGFRNILHELSSWDERMIAAARDRQGVARVLEIAAEQLGNPIALMDSSLNLVSAAGDLSSGYESTIWEDVLERRYSPFEFYTRDERDDIEQRLISHGTPQIFKPRRSPGHSNLCALLTVGGKSFGVIGQVDIATAFTPYQIALAGHVRDRLELALAMEVGRYGEDELATLMRGVVTGDTTDPGILRLHLSKLAWCDEPLIVAVFAAPENGDANSLSLQSWVDRVSGLIPDAVFFMCEETLVAVMRKADFPHGEGKDARFVEALAGLDTRCAASAVCEDLDGIRSYYLQARITLGEAKRRNLGRLVAYEDVLTGYIVHSLLEIHEERVICNPHILDLVEKGYKGDVTMGRELVLQLFVYLANGCNNRAAARKLFLHRNTLSYRMQRIESLLNVELDTLDEEAIFALELSCLIALRDGELRLVGDREHRETDIHEDGG